MAQVLSQTGLRSGVMGTAWAVGCTCATPSYPVPDVCDVLGNNLSMDVYEVWDWPRNQWSLKGRDACQEPGALPLLQPGDPLMLLTDCLALASQTPAEEMLE